MENLLADTFEDVDVLDDELLEALISNEEEEEVVVAAGGQHHEKHEEYFKTVEAYNDEDFITHFRIGRPLAHRLAERFRRSHYFSYQEGGEGKLDPYEQVLIFLWFAGHEAASFRDVSDRFGIVISTLFKVSRRLMYFLSSLSPEIIKWPDDDEKVEIARAYEQMGGLPNVIGAIDGTHVRIDRPSEDPDSYYNSKKYHSIHMQAVCDHRRRIRSVFIGFPGSVHDARAYRWSPLGQQLATLCGECYVLGDSAYPCVRNLITSFKDTGNLNRAQRTFNRVHSKLRIEIEHRFGILKQKFRQLYHCKLRKITDTAHFIRACCVLHNLSLAEHLREEPEVPQEVVEEMDLRGDVDGRDAADGVAYRNYLLSILYTQ